MCCSIVLLAFILIQSYSRFWIKCNVVPALLKVQLELVLSALISTAICSYNNSIKIYNIHQSIKECEVNQQPIIDRHE